MFAQRKFFLLFAAVAVMLSVSVFVVSAQDNGDTTWPPSGMMGRHGMSMGAHLMWDGESAPMFTAVAEALGIDTQTLVAELQSGKTLTQLAEAAGVDLAAVTEAAQTTMQQHLDELVASGALTQAQADARLSLMQEHWAEMPHLNCTDCGLMMGGMGRGGMWDNNDTTRGGRMGRGR